MTLIRITRAFAFSRASSNRDALPRLGPGARLDFGPRPSFGSGSEGELAHRHPRASRPLRAARCGAVRRGTREGKQLDEVAEISEGRPHAPAELQAPPPRSGAKRPRQSHPARTRAGLARRGLRGAEPGCLPRRARATTY